MNKPAIGFNIVRLSISKSYVGLLLVVPHIFCKYSFLITGFNHSVLLI